MHLRMLLAVVLTVFCRCVSLCMHVGLDACYAAGPGVVRLAGRHTACTQGRLYRT